MAETLKEFEELEKVEKPASETSSTTPSPTEVKEVVKENVVIIDGKERPLKNYEAELRRKHEEDIERTKSEYEQRLSQIHQQATQQSQQNYLERVYQMAENEIATTGKAVPIQTILEVSNSLFQRNIGEVLKNKDSAEKTVRSFKRTIRKDPDFGEIEDEFDGLIDQLKPEQVNAVTLEVCLNSVRGKRIKDIEKRAYERGKKEIEKDTQILNVTTETGSGATRPSSALSPEQKYDLERMNKDTIMDWTETEYLDALNKKKQRFKASGSKNEPVLLSDQMIK